MPTIWLKPHSSRLARYKLAKSGSPERADEESFWFSVCDDNGSHSRVDLTTGERLSKLRGDITINRGVRLDPDGSPYKNVLCYVQSAPSTGDYKGHEACYGVDLYVDDDQFKRLCPLAIAGKFPSVELAFDPFVDEGIKFGNAPDGSDKIWDTKQFPGVPISSFVLTYEIERRPDCSEIPKAAADLELAGGKSNDELMNGFAMEIGQSNGLLVGQLRRFVWIIVFAVWVPVLLLLFFR